MSNRNAPKVGDAFVFRYKDSCRIWWRVDIRAVEEHPIEWAAGKSDLEWEYTVTNELLCDVDGAEGIPYFFRAFLRGQYAYVPGVDTVMVDFQAEMGRVAIEGAGYLRADEWQPSGPRVPYEITEPEETSND